MGKQYNERRNKTKKSASKETAEKRGTPVAASQTTITKNAFKIFRNPPGRFVTWLTAICGLLGISVIQIFTDWFSCNKSKDHPTEVVQEPAKDTLTQYEKLIEAEYWKGILIPDYVINNDQSIMLALGTNLAELKMDDLKRGLILNPPYLFCPDSTGKKIENPMNLSFYMIGNRLGISTTFKDMETEEEVGIMERNKWLLKKDKSLYFNPPTDTSLVVFDARSRVIFSLKFKKPNFIFFKGYFIGKTFISVTNDRSLAPCILKSKPNSKLIADSLLSLIKERRIIE